MKLSQIAQNSIIPTFIGVFIVLYFLFIIQTYIIPNEYEISLVLLIGFAILITGIFCFFLNINSPNSIVAKVKILDENAIKAILIMLMVITIFIPAVSFSDLVIAWIHIPILNYFRGAVFLIGALFLPGACIFNLIVPNSTIHKRLNVEPFLVKLTIYPIISLTYLGSVTLFLDFFGFTGVSILTFLFFSFIFLFVLDIFFQRHNTNDKNILKIKISEITISRYTFLILFIGLSIIIIALGVLFFIPNTPYGVAGDRWRGISSASLIGVPDTSPFASTQIYSQYWGCVIFSLSILCGIPYINTNVLLFLFLYLSITSFYLLIKALLNNIDEKFCLLSSIFLAIMFNPNKLILQFSFHSFAFLTLFLSLTLFFIAIKSNNIKNRQNITTENVVLLTLSSLFLIQSLMLYFIPALIGIITLFFYSLFSDNLKHYLKNLLLFFLFMIIFFLIFDLITYNFFSWICIRSIENFSGRAINLQAQADLYLLRRFLTSFRFYGLLLSILILLLFIYKFSSRVSITLKKVKLKIKIILEKKYKYLFILITAFISICLLIANLDFTFKERLFLSEGGGVWRFNINLQVDFLIFYLSTLLGAIGFYGILGIYLSYLCFKVNKNLFFFLLSWFVLIIGLASSLIFLRWIQYPNSLVSNIPEDHYGWMRYWFTRTWYYSMIPLSIFTSICLIKLIQNIKSRGWFKVKSRGWFKIKTYKNIGSIASFSLISVLIFFSLSSPIIEVIWGDNYPRISDEYAQIIGWTSKNIPKDSQILLYPYDYNLRRMELDLYLYKTFSLHEEINNALVNYKEQDQDLYKWRTNKSAFGYIKLLYEENGRKNVILLHDKSNSGGISMLNEFLAPQINGSISFWLKMDIADENVDAGLYLRIYGENYDEGIDFYMNHGYHYYYNDSDIISVMNEEYGANEWYYYQIYFNCTQSQGYWNVYVNGAKMNNNISGKSDLEFRGNPTNFSRVQISTTSLGKDYRIYFDVFNFSWAPITAENDFCDRILNDIAKLIPYLNTNNIQYFILQKKYMYEYQELLDYFYRIKLYQYGNFIIYRSIEI